MKLVTLNTLDMQRDALLPGDLVRTLFVRPFIIISVGPEVKSWMGDYWLCLIVGRVGLRQKRVFKTDIYDVWRWL